uniref:Fibroblast activation protein, alpha n=1 Tax=Sparus aurata TaxID=8175 RepID=A0A671YKD6_SPAAU
SQGCSKVMWGVVGAAVVITLITIPAVYFSGKSGGAKRPYTFEDYFNDTIRWKSFNVYWISDKEYLHKDRDGNLFLYNAETKQQSLYLSNSTFVIYIIYFHILLDNKVLVFVFLIRQKWRHSYTLLVAHQNQLTAFFVFQAYITDYNIFIKSNVNAETVQVTHNGKKNEIQNGVPDWVYEEEVFASNGAIWWSSTGKYLAYVEFNDTDVHKVEFSWFGSEQYPETVIFPYPKAGSPLTKVKLFVVDTTNPSRRTQVVAPASVASGDHILCSVTWPTDERVAVQWLTRKQNYVVVQIYDFDGSNWREKQVSVTSPHTYNLCFYKVMSDAKGYKHIHYVKDVSLFLIISVEKNNPTAKINVSKLKDDLSCPLLLFLRVMIGSSPSAPQCLTCSLNEDRCQYNSAYFSSDASYYRVDCYGQLPTRIFTLSIKSSVWEASVNLGVLEDNKDLENILSEFQMPTMKYVLLPTDLWYQMMLPPNFKKSKKYPLLIDVYGGPCSQRVDYRFKLNWGTYLSSSQGIIIASFDGRGSGYQGDAILHAIYKRLGTFEVEDQMTAVRKFIDMGFIDKDRIAIWGWSYGGYVTSMALGAGTGLFKCGIAVAPVAKWEYYDAVYTERYMGTPTDNSDSYKNSSVMARAKNFKTVNYLLVHGTADDNVHFQQAAQISKALVDEQVDFEAMWYTDKDHGLRGSAMRHNYALMSHFLQKCLLNPK